MIDVSTYIINTMKRIIFNQDGINAAARLILAELKTKQVDVIGDITTEYQYKMLKKMKDDRLKTAMIYKKADRIDLEQKELVEIQVIDELIKELQKDMPPIFTEDQTIELVLKFKRTNPGCKIGEFMKYISVNKINIDKKIAAMVFNK